MLSYEQALAAVLRRCNPLPCEHLPLLLACGRYLAEPLVAPMDLPRFDISAVDGYGVRIDDILAASLEQPVCLRTNEVLHAGMASNTELQPESAIKLMTGAPIPPGVEAVVMREDALELVDAVQIRCALNPGTNIRSRGSDCHAGDMLASAGSRLNPPLLALHAAQGLATAVVEQAPRIALLTTGDEIVPPGIKVGPGQIYNSNSIALAAALLRLDLRLEQTRDCVDDLRLIVELLRHYMVSADVIISTGGVSAGDKDYVREACQQLDMQLVFHGIAVKPGKPVLFATFARHDGSDGLFFGLPGNPVGALLSFHKLVRPALLCLMGASQAFQSRCLAKLTSSLGKPAGRLEFVRGQARPVDDGLEVEPIAARESHMLKGLVDANCLICFPQESEELAAGTHVEIEWLSWS